MFTGSESVGLEIRIFLKEIDLLFARRVVGPGYAYIDYWQVPIMILTAGLWTIRYT